MKNPQEAIKHFESCVDSIEELDQFDPGIKIVLWQNMANCYRQLNKPDKAALADKVIKNILLLN